MLKLKVTLKFTKYYAICLQLIPGLVLLGCGQKEEPKVETPVVVNAQFEECILDKKLSIKETKELENKFGSQLVQGAEQTYKRSGKCDSIPFEVTYRFEKDSIASVKYIWSNLPGLKKEIETRLKILIKLIEKRTGESARFLPDKHRVDVPMTRRIEFYDAYFWDKKNKNYSARINYHDSGRAGESSLTLEIYL